MEGSFGDHLVLLPPGAGIFASGVKYQKGKGNKGKGKKKPGRRDTLRAHFYIYHGGNILRKEQDWREVINFLCNLGVKMEDLHSHGMKV